MPFFGEWIIRTSVYIDGFNFYYSAVKDTPYRWTDLKVLCNHILQSKNKITAIHYFTARVSDSPQDPTKSTRQDTYLRALKAYIPEFHIHYGHFLRHKKFMPLVEKPNKSVQVIHTEEKGSDVNLAVHLLNDAWLNTYDCGVVISNDSDLAEAIKLSKAQSKVIGVITTRHTPTQNLRENASFYRRLTKTHLNKSPLPEIIPGTNIRKPKTW